MLQGAFCRLACDGFLQPVMAYQLLLAIRLVLAMYTGLTGSARSSSADGDEKHLTGEHAALSFMQQRHADNFTLDIDALPFKTCSAESWVNYVMDCPNYMNVTLHST